ncbi:hypothetical protein BC829DRAFT_172283 [Chytridium lagenaria]|nr:hypothetical protein BC829DRAFT_172283 [Chytridium lagenaria]
MGSSDRYGGASLTPRDMSPGPVTLDRHKPSFSNSSTLVSPLSNIKTDNFVIAPRSSSMKGTMTIDRKTSHKLRGLMMGGEAEFNRGETSPVPGPSPDSPSAEVAKILADERYKQEGRDVFDLEIIRSRCIRIYGIDEQSHIIDVGDYNDAVKIRHKILRKFNIIDAKERKHYSLFILDPSKGDGVIRIDDAELLRICRSRTSEAKGHLILRKAFLYPNAETQRAQQLQRLQELIVSQASPGNPSNASIDLMLHSMQKKENPAQKIIQESEWSQKPQGRARSATSPAGMALPNFNYSAPPSSIRIPSSDSRVSSKAISDQRSGYDSPSSSSMQRNPSSSRRISRRTSSRRQNSDTRSKLISRKKESKFESFFGERPPDELIAEQLEQYFPDIEKVSLPPPPRQIPSTPTSDQIQNNSSATQLQEKNL